MKINNAYQNQNAAQASSSKKTEGSTQAKALKSEAPENKKIDSSNSQLFKATESEISSKGKDFAKAFAIATETPDVREDRVAELRKKIQSGEYKVNAEAIAEKMLSEHSA